MDDKSFRIRFLDMNTADCYPAATDSPATIITTATEDDDRWIINDRQEDPKRDPSMTNAGK